MTKPLISVVVPLYRVEAEMPLCVDSVLAQTYDRLDVILVDDGSPDGCGRLAEDYARRDARVRAIHRENGGLSAARNTGTLAAKGDYITYVDGDDFLHPVCVESLYGLIERYRADLKSSGRQRAKRPALNAKRPWSTCSISGFSIQAHAANYTAPKMRAGSFSPWGGCLRIWRRCIASCGARSAQHGRATRSTAIARAGTAS